MAANKFATMLHKNTHRITAILVYALLEWILITLLLLNSLFTYLITKFANYFGLKPPCIWCSRVDHVLEPNNTTNSYRNLVCETHATEISTLSYCSQHKKLAESHNMCSHCLASQPNHTDKSIGITRRIAFLTWVSGDKVENVEKCVGCSCCDESLNSKIYRPYLLFKSPWGNLEESQKRNLSIEILDDESNGNEHKEESKQGNQRENGDKIERKDGEGCDQWTVECDKEQANEEEEADTVDMIGTGTNPCDEKNVKFCSREDDSIESINLLEKYVYCEFDRLVPVELIDSSTSANRRSIDLNEDPKICDHYDETLDSAVELESQGNILTETSPFMMNENLEKISYGEHQSLEIDPSDVVNSLNINSKERKRDIFDEECELVPNTKAVQNQSITSNKVQEQSLKEEHDSSEAIPSFQCQQEEHQSINVKGADILHAAQESEAPSDFEHKGKPTKEENMALFGKNQEGINHQLSMRLEQNDVEEEKIPDTPTSVENLHHLHKKLLLFEKRESGTEESLDGSVVSEMEGGDSFLTIERLKSALKAERKALNALYAELEEERSASAIAANQTMAMITRLQEEKAAMQMEALQYQRMMEEQSEYDQEALQLLNELMNKREEEKQELEKELEGYRKKVSDYEAKERIRVMRRSTDGSVRSRNSSASCSNVDDSDGLSIDLNRLARDEDSNFYSNQESSSNNTPADEVLNLEEMALDCVKHMSVLDESLTEFEEERLSILDQLKALEEKLLTIGDDEFIEDLKSIEQSANCDNIDGFDENHDFGRENEISNGYSKERNYPERKTLGSMAKTLLPLLDAAETETEEGLLYEEQAESVHVDIQNAAVSKFDLDSKKLAIEEEVDHVYDRLQALEADREFLKHCMSSIKKGDKGMDLLQEILQHLRDLRSVELRVRNMSDSPIG